MGRKSNNVRKRNNQSTLKKSNKQIRKERKQAKRKARLNRALKSRKTTSYQSVDKSSKTHVKDKRVAELSFWEHNVIENFFNNVNRYPEARMSAVIESWANTIIDEKGVKSFSDMISKAYDNGLQVTWYVLYNQDGANEFMLGCLRFLDESGFYKDSVESRIENMLHFGELMEGVEEWTDYDE